MSILIKLWYFLVALIIEALACTLVQRHSARSSISEQLCRSLWILRQFERATSERTLVVLEIRVRAEDRVQEIAALALLGAFKSRKLLPGLWVVMRLISFWLSC